MIITDTKCSECIHSKICMNKSEKENLLAQLKKTKVDFNDVSSNSYVIYEQLSNQMDLNIVFHCLNFISKKREQTKCTF